MFASGAGQINQICIQTDTLLCDRVRRCCGDQTDRELESTGICLSQTVPLMGTQKQRASRGSAGPPV
jgi:hypothetical protein